MQIILKKSTKMKTLASNAFIIQFQKLLEIYKFVFLIRKELQAKLEPIQLIKRQRQVMITSNLMIL